MPRWVWLSFVAATPGAVVLVLTAGPLPWRPGVTAANVAAIKPGMRLAEVEALMGSRGRCLFSLGGLDNWRDCYRWERSDGEAVVWFHVTGGEPEGRAETAMYHPYTGPLTRLRDWLSRRQ